MQRKGKSEKRIVYRYMHNVQRKKDGIGTINPATSAKNVVQNIQTKSGTNTKVPYVL